jgi:hypothetical protein
MHTFSATTAAPPEVVWRLIARPADWARWSPHVRGAWGLGEPEVCSGAAGAVRLLGGIALPARVTGKHPGRSWRWRVGGVVETVHRVEPQPDGRTRVVVDLIAPGPLEPALALAYGPLIDVGLHRLAQEAERVVGAPA